MFYSHTAETVHTAISQLQTTGILDFGKDYREYKAGIMKRLDAIF